MTSDSPAEQPSPPATRRTRLSNRRAHELVSLQYAGMRYTAGIGRFPDGALAEIFINAEKVGTAIEVQARDAAILASFALQHGASADELRHALSREGNGKASGVLGALLDLLCEAAPR